MTSDSITPIRRTTLSESVMEQLARLITNGVFAPGEQLPSERELAAQFDVARGPVREALRALALIGLVDIKPSQGAFVRDRASTLAPGQTARDLLTKEVGDVLEVYQARRVIEGAQILMATQHIGDEQLDVLDGLMRDMRRAARENPLDASRFAELHYQFDFIVAKAARNQVLLGVFESIRELEMATHLKTLLLPDAMANSVFQHDRILEALRKHEPALAEDAVRTHFESADRLLSTWLSDSASESEV